jgi:hypothetical protein
MFEVQTHLPLRGLHRTCGSRCNLLATATIATPANPVRNMAPSQRGRKHPNREEFASLRGLLFFRPEQNNDKPHPLICSVQTECLGLIAQLGCKGHRAHWRRHSVGSRQASSGMHPLHMRNNLGAHPACRRYLSAYSKRKAAPRYAGRQRVNRDTARSYERIDVAGAIPEWPFARRSVHSTPSTSARLNAASPNLHHPQ